MTTATANPSVGFIDVEASGFGAGSYPIEVAFAHSQDAIESYLVCPAPSWTHWSDEAERLHGLSRERLLTEGKPVDFIAQWLNSTLKGHILFSDAWHYDFSWIHRLFSEVGTLPEFKIASVEELLTQEQSKLWAMCKADVAASLQLTQHRAGNDVRLLLATFEAVSHL